MRGIRRTRSNSLKLLLQAGTLILGATALFATHNAYAVPTPGYCIDPVPVNMLSVYDASITIGANTSTSVASDCYGIVNTGRSNLDNNLTFVNGLRWDDFVGGITDDTIDANAATGTFGGITYSIKFEADSGSGLDRFSNYRITWEDANGVDEPNLPVLVDLVLQWKGNTNSVFYLFEDLKLLADPKFGIGTIDIKVTNSQNNSRNSNGLNDTQTSHLSAFFGQAVSFHDPETNPNATIPEPMPLILIALGGLALGWFNRNNQQT